MKAQVAAECGFCHCSVDGEACHVEIKGHQERHQEKASSNPQGKKKSQTGKETHRKLIRRSQCTVQQNRSRICQNLPNTPYLPVGQPHLDPVGMIRGAGQYRRDRPSGKMSAALVRLAYDENRRAGPDIRSVASVHSSLHLHQRVWRSCRLRRRSIAWANAPFGGPGTPADRPWPRWYLWWRVPGEYRRPF